MNMYTRVAVCFQPI